MTTAVCWFLISLLLSMGISINADNLGDGLAQAIDEAITTSTSENVYTDEEIQKLKAIQKYLDNPIFAEYVLTEEELALIYNHGTYVPSDVVIDAIGEDSWEEFLQGHQLHRYDKNKSISTADGYTITFFADRHPSYNAETGAFNFYCIWYEVTDPYGNVIKRDYDVSSGIYGFSDLEDANLALENSYIDEEERFHLVSYNGKELCITDCATLFPDGVNTDFPPAVIDGAIIGIIEGADGATYEIGADGAITLPDGSVVYPNEDGTYTINNVNYYPTEYNLAAYDDSALLGLLQQVISRLDDIENALEFEKPDETEKDEELEAAQDEALEKVEEYEGTLENYVYSSPKWTTIFPFCIPWDFVRGVKLVSAKPVAPKFVIPFEIPEFLFFPGYKSEIVLDFSEFEEYFVPVRWFTTVFFLMGLGFITFKIVKGAA